GGGRFCAVALERAIVTSANTDTEKTGQQVRFECIPDTLQRTVGRCPPRSKRDRKKMRAVIESTRTSATVSHHNLGSVRRKSSGGAIAVPEHSEECRKRCRSQPRKPGFFASLWNDTKPLLTGTLRLHSGKTPPASFLVQWCWGHPCRGKHETQGGFHIKLSPPSSPVRASRQRVATVR